MGRHRRANWNRPHAFAGAVGNIRDPKEAEAIAAMREAVDALVAAGEAFVAAMQRLGDGFRARVQADLDYHVNVAKMACDGLGPAELRRAGPGFEVRMPGMEVEG